MPHIRPMVTDDFRAVIKLTSIERWGFGIRDLQRMLTIQPEGCFVATDGGRLIGLTTTVSYGRLLGWIGNVVVDKDYRKKRTGSNLVKTAVAHLARLGVRRIGLNSFAENESMYERLGFEAVNRFVTLSVSRRTRERTERAVQVPFSRIVRTDRRAFGADRSKLLRCLLNDFPEGWTWICRGPELSGYAVVKQYRDSSEIGPSICEGRDRDSALGLLRSSIAMTRKWPLEVSIPNSNIVFLETAKRAGFKVLRKGLVMTLTGLEKVKVNSSILALGFLDKG